MRLNLRSERKHDPELRRYCYCSDDPPPMPEPDPTIGEAMKKMAETGAKTADYQMALTEQFKPYYQDLLNLSIQAGRDATRRADQEWNTYQTYGAPLSRISMLLDSVDPTNALSEDERNTLLKQFADAERSGATGTPGQIENLSKAINTASRRAAEAAGMRAGAEVGRQHDLAQQVAERNASRMGVNPGSTAAAFASRGAGLQRAADMAGAVNNARTSANMAGLAARGNAMNIARGYPSTTMGLEGQGLANRSAAVGTMGAQQSTSIAGGQAALPWYQGAAQTGIGLHDAAMRGWGAQVEHSARNASGLGSLLGTVAGRLLPF